MTIPGNWILNSDDADQLRDLADRLDRAWHTSERITDANPGVARQLRDFTEQAGNLATIAREIADYADAVDEGRVRHVTGTARHQGPGDKVQLHVPGEPEPLVTSVQAIIRDTGLTRVQVDGQLLRFTVITTTGTGDQVDTPTGFQV
jgi:hypothetical protein